MNVQRWEVSGYYKQEFDFVVGLQKRGFEVLPSYDGSREYLPFPGHADVGVEGRYDHEGPRRGRFLFPIDGQGDVFEQCPDNYSFFSRRSEEPVVPWRTCHGVWADGVLTIIPEQGEQIVVDLSTNATDLYSLATQAQNSIAGDWVLGLFLRSLEADLDELKKNAGFPRISSDDYQLPCNAFVVDEHERHLVVAQVYASDMGLAKAFGATLCNNKITTLRITSIPDMGSLVVETPKKKYRAITKKVGDTNISVGMWLSPFVTDTSGDFCYVLRDKNMDDKEFYQQVLVRLQNSMSVPVEEHWITDLVSMALQRGVMRECFVWGEIFTYCLYISLEQKGWIDLVNDAITQQIVSFSFDVGSLPEIETEGKSSNEPVIESPKDEWDNEQDADKEELPIWPD